MLKLDLHRKRHEDAKREVIRFVENNWDCDDMAEIITGNSSRMKKLVCDVLDEYNLYWRTSAIQGYIIVDLN